MHKSSGSQLYLKHFPEISDPPVGNRSLLLHSLANIVLAVYSYSLEIFKFTGTVNISLGSYTCWGTKKCLLSVLNLSIKTPCKPQKSRWTIPLN